MKFKNIGRRPHYLTDERLIQPGEVIETDVDLATAFPDKFLSADSLAGKQPQMCEIPQEVVAPVAEPEPATEATEKHKKVGARRSRRATK